MNILVVNDDGYEAPGLKVLVEALSRLKDTTVFVSAPKDHQSAKSHAITIRRRIGTFEADPIPGSVRTFVVDGTPADATRLGLKVFDDIDLVVSGINYGQNIAKDILYSGTVAAAWEAKVLGVNAIAISAPTPYLSYLPDETVRIFKWLLTNGYHEGSGILNINFPHDSHREPKGIRFTTQGQRFQRAEYVKSEHPDIFHIKSSLVGYKEAVTTDVEAYNSGYVSITPLTLERTDLSWFDALSKHATDIVD
jgi:5'-nucleotidase